MNEKRFLSMIDGILSIAAVLLLLLAVNRVGSIGASAPPAVDLEATFPYAFVRIDLRRQNGTAKPLLPNRFPEPGLGWKSNVVVTGNDEFSVIYFSAAGDPKQDQAAQSPKITIPLFVSEQDKWSEGFDIQSLRVQGELSPDRIPQLKSVNENNLADSINSALKGITELTCRFETTPKSE